jgi:SAM-dependent methyltransferase
MSGRPKTRVEVSSVESRYTSGEYIERHKSWHIEDSQWKADRIYGILKRNNVQSNVIADIGCGAGGILHELALKDQFALTFKGFDISPQAIELAKKRESKNVMFYCKDLMDENERDIADVLLVIDVFEHVKDYINFLSRCKNLAKFKVYHIPLDIHVSSVVRDSFNNLRRELGHLHYFTANSAIATLEDTGHEIVDQVYTDGAFGLSRQHPSIKRTIGNIPRRLLSLCSVPLTARFLGGYSLLVLAK